MNPVDLLGREIFVDDYVVFTNCLYQVVGVGKTHYGHGAGQVRIMLVNPSKTTRPVTKYSTDMCKVPIDDVMAMLDKETK